MYKALTTLLFVLFVNAGYSQINLHDDEKIIKADFEKLVLAENDSVKITLCNSIEDKLTNILKNEESFEYSFVALNKLGKLTSPDNAFRIYNWNCVLNDGSYRYFGLIQHVFDKKLQVDVLNDSNIASNMMNQYGKSNWPGALYYKIIPFKQKGKKAYFLLAWDGNNVQTSKKVIEVLSIDKQGELKFGSPVINWKGKMLNRVVFEYAKQARMTIQYLEKEKRLVFDHLAPSSPMYSNQFEYYGPDFSYDALEYQKGKWVLVENVEVRNKKKNER